MEISYSSSGAGEPQFTFIMIKLRERDRLGYGKHTLTHKQLLPHSDLIFTWKAQHQHFQVLLEESILLRLMLASVFCSRECLSPDGGGFKRQC